MTCPNCGELHPSIRVGRAFLIFLVASASILVAIGALVSWTGPDLDHAKLIEDPENGSGQYLICRNIDQLRKLRSAGYPSATSAIGDGKRGCLWTSGYPIKDVRFKADGYQPEVVTFELAPDVPFSKDFDGEWYTWRSNLADLSAN